MTSVPKIPMRPEELPQQRITLVASLPPRPAGFVGKREPPESVLPPAKTPRSAKYIGQVEWAWGPNNTRLDAYYLSTNRQRTHWFLWLRYYDDNWGKWDESQIRAYAPMSAKDAPGRRFHVYGIDYGCYVDLINTAKAPRGLLDLGEGTPEFSLGVPKSDFRSIRRCVLYLDDFYARNEEGKARA